MSSRSPSSPPPSSVATPTAPASPGATVPPTDRRPRKWRRRLRRIIIGLFATFVGLIATLLAVLHTDWGREQIRRQAVGILNGVFPGGVELRRLEGSVLSVLTVRDVALFDARGRRVVTIERAAVDLGLVALLRNTIELKQIDVEGVTVIAFQDEEGMNLGKLTKPSEDDSPSTWRIELDDVNLLRGSFAIVRPNPELPGLLAADHFEELEIHGAVVVEPGELLSPTTQGPSTITANVTLSGLWRERLARARVQADAKIHDGVIEVAKADASFGGLRALATDVRYAGPTASSGTVELHGTQGALLQLLPSLPTSPAFALEVNAAPLSNGSLGVMRVQLGGTIADARLGADLVVTPMLARPRVAGQLRLANVHPVTLLGSAAPPALAELSLAEALIALDASAALDPFTLDGVVASLELSGRVDHGISRMPINASAKLSGRHLIADVNGATGASNIAAHADVTLTEEQLLAIREARVSGHLAAADVPAQFRQNAQMGGVIDLSLRATGSLSLAGPETGQDGPKAASATPADAGARTAGVDLTSAKTPGAALVAAAPAAKPLPLGRATTPRPASAAAKALRSAKAAAAAAAAGNSAPQQLAVIGMINGTGLRYDNFSAGKVDIELMPAVVATWPRGRVRVAVSDITASGRPMPNLQLIAKSNAPGIIDLDAKLEPRFPRAAGDEPAAGKQKDSDLEAAKTVAKAAAAAAMALSTATAPPAAVATTTVKSLAVAVAAASKPPVAPKVVPSIPLLDALSEAFSTSGKLGVNATVKLGLDNGVTVIDVRHLDAGIRGLQLGGRGGEITISPNRLDVRGLRLKGNFGAIAADLSKRGNHISGTVALERVELAPLGAVLPPLRGLSGTIGLQATGSLRGRVLQADLRLAAAKLVAAPGAAVIDADVVANVAPQKPFHLAVRARNNAVGELILGLDVMPPADPTNVAAWMALERSAIERLSLHSQRINLAALRRAIGAPAPTLEAIGAGAPPAPMMALDGRVAIDLELTPAGGTLKTVIDDVIVPGAPSAIDLTANLDVDGSGRGALVASAKMTGVAAKATAVVQLPNRPLAPGAWALTAERLSKATLEVPSFVVGDAMAKQLGLGSWRGRAAATFQLEDGLRKLSGKVLVDQVRGGPLQRPIAVLADLSVEGGKAKLVATANLESTQALRIEASLPLALDSDDPMPDFQTLPLDGKLTIGPLEAVQVATAMGATARTLGADPRPDQPSTGGAEGVLSRPAAPATPTPPPQGSAKAIAPSTAPVFDRTGSVSPAAVGGAQAGRRRLSGTLSGEATITGTMAAPELALKLLIAELGTQRSKIKELRIAARFADGALKAELTGTGQSGGTLKGIAELDPAKPRDARITLDAKAFDLSPLARLVPTALLGVTAQLDGNMQVQGTDPKTMQVGGNLTISNFRLPIANQVGTLTEGVIKLGVTRGRATITADGKIESGKVALKASAALDGVLPRSGALEVNVTGLSLITPFTPIIDATLKADAKLADGRWQVVAKLSKGNVRIPDQQGRVLHPVGPPADLVFVSNARTVTDPPPSLAESARSWAAGRARNPWLTIDLDIQGVTVRSKEATGTVRGEIDVAIADDGLSVDGDIGLSGGDVLLFGRHYDVSRASVIFDGPIDPNIDLQLQHDFPQMTLMVSARGRISATKLHFSSAPATYNEAQLLGFFLGGSPGAGRDSTPDAANSVAAAVASQTIGSFLTRQLPVRIDVLAYQPQTLSSSGSLVAGRWLTEKLLLMVRSRSDPRPLENSAEGELQYWLRRGLLLDGVAGDSGTFGLDLLWNRRW